MNTKISHEGGFKNVAVPSMYIHTENKLSIIFKLSCYHNYVTL